MPTFPWHLGCMILFIQIFQSLKGLCAQRETYYESLVPLCLECQESISHVLWVHDILMGMFWQAFWCSHFWGRHCDAAVLTGTFWWDIWMKPYLCFFFFSFYQFILLANGKNKTLHSIPWENLSTDRRWFKMEGGQRWENWAGTSVRSIVTKSVFHSHSSQKRPSIIPGNGSGHLWEFTCILNELHKISSSLP